MNRKLIIAAGVGAQALLLAACNPNGANNGAVNLGHGDNRICTPFTPVAAPAANSPGALAPAVVADNSSAVDDCLHRWAYTLAGSHDPADLVGQAAVAACATAVSAWNEQALEQRDPRAREAYSLTTGEPSNPIAAHGEFARSRALFYVVQARAGNCAPPPAERTATTRTPG